MALFNAIPASGIRPESPLAHIAAASPLTQDSASAGVAIRELACLGHLVLRGDGSDPEFCAGVGRALEMALPLRGGMLSFNAARTASIQWMSPEEWLVIVPGGQEFAVEQALRAHLQGHFAVINVSGAQTVLELSGPAVREMLMKSTPYDVSPRNFPVGKGVSSVFAKSSAVIRRIDDASWQLVIRRSFADYLYRWILDASAEFGVLVLR